MSSAATVLARAPGSSELLERLRRTAAAGRTTVLVHGESGTGKELVARAIHELSPRGAGPFVALNCAALTEGLLEAELFGYEPGAFTGGDPKGREGLLHAAEGGTLVFDEIGELALALQAKLLRALQERSYRRIGAREERAFDVRILALTHRDLAAEVSAGRFREDLFYRLNVLSLSLAPLRARGADLAVLARGFLERAVAESGREVNGFSPQAWEAMQAHTWPGNVRELEHTIQRAVLLGSSPRVELQDLALCAPRSAATADVLALGDRSLRSVEQRLIERVLEETGGNRSRAASVLGIHRTTLYAKLRDYGIAV